MKSFENVKSCHNEAKSKAKVWYDRQVRERTFDIVTVLVVLPMPGKSLLVKYQGPYQINAKVGPADYMIATPNACLSHKHAETICGARLEIDIAQVSRQLMTRH